MKQKTFAKFLLLIACCHFLLGILIFKSQLLTMINLGWININGPDYIEESLAFWFLIFSLPLGVLVIQFWNQNEVVPTKTIVALLLLSLIGGISAPVGGFWTLTILCVVALHIELQSRKIAI